MQHFEIIKMGYAFQKFLEQEKLINVKPKDIMPLLTEKGYFNKDHRAGLPLRNVLRELDDKNLLYLVPQVRVERKATNRFWFFNAIEG